MGYMCLFQLWFPQGIYLGEGLLVHIVVLFLVFKGISIPSSIVAVSIYIPTNSVRVFPFLHTFPAFTVCSLFDEGHSDWCKLISHCSFEVAQMVKCLSTVRETWVRSLGWEESLEKEMATHSSTLA